MGAVAQLGERCVRNAEVGGSNPPRSTIIINVLRLNPLYIVTVNVTNRDDGESNTLTAALTCLGSDARTAS